jgi:hypothetical protein
LVCRTGLQGTARDSTTSQIRPAWVLRQFPDLHGGLHRREAAGSGFHNEGFLGHATFNPAKPDEQWQFHPVSPKDNRFRRFTQVAVVDLNIDKQPDTIVANKRGIFVHLNNTASRATP